MAFPGLGFDFLIRIGKNAGVLGVGLFNTNDPNYRDKKHELIKLLQGDFSIVLSFRKWILFVALTHGSREEAEHASFWTGSSLQGSSREAALESDAGPAVSVSSRTTDAEPVPASASSASAGASRAASSAAGFTGGSRTGKPAPKSMTPEMESAWAPSSSDGNSDEDDAMNDAWASPEPAKAETAQSASTAAGSSRKYEDEKGVPWGTRAQSSHASPTSGQAGEPPSTSVPGAEESEGETEGSDDFLEGLPDLKSLIRERKKRRFSA